MAKRRHNKDLPIKVDPAEFGGGRRRGYYTDAEIRQLLCSRAGCGRFAVASWGACCDGNVQRPFCPECDVSLNWQCLIWAGDPEWEAKLTAYARQMEQRAGRQLDLRELPFLTRDESPRPNASSPALGRGLLTEGAV